MWGKSSSLVVAAVEKNLEYGPQNQFRIHFREIEFIFVLHCGGLQKHIETQLPLNSHKQSIFHESNIRMQ